MPQQQQRAAQPIGSGEYKVIHFNPFCPRKSTMMNYDDCQRELTLFIVIWWLLKINALPYIYILYESAIVTNKNGLSLIRFSIL